VKKNKDKIGFRYAPWDDFKHIEEPQIPIDEPPCKYCIHFKPVVMHQETLNIGVRLCHTNEMYRDFSCYRTKDKELSK
jgi:hypothetical protein